MPKTLQMLAAERTRKGAVNLIRLLQIMPAERLHWKPLSCGRTVIEQLIECVMVNRKWALTLRQKVYTRVPAAMAEQIQTACQDVGQLSQLLQETAEELAAAILALPAEQLDSQIVASFGTYSVADCCLLGYWNMVYHEGQINYIQTLYGDQAAYVHF